MNLWKELKHTQDLTNIQKIVLGMLIIMVVIFVPESAFLLDVGGIDLFLFIFFFYSQSIKLWVELHFGCLKYPNIGRKTFVTHMTFTSIFMWVTGSVVFAYGVFLVLMFLKGS